MLGRGRLANLAALWKRWTRPWQAAKKAAELAEPPQALKRDLIFKELAAGLGAASFQASIQPEFVRNLLVLRA